MLSAKQQMFLISILMRDNNTNGLKRNQQDIWKSNTFYRNTGYLIKSGLINTEEIVNGRRFKIYKLTWGGNILARLLLRCHELKRKYPKAQEDFKL